MTQELRLTVTMYGFANSVFYIAYAACEIPSDLMQVRVGASRWLGSIMTVGDWRLAPACW